VIRPLAFDRDINGVLAVEYAGGEDLSTVLRHGILNHDEAQLFERLTALAFFLATLHNRTANGATVNFARECAYLDTLVARLFVLDRMPAETAQELVGLRDRWRDRGRMWQDRQVWLHGDATPSNFLFGADLDVTAIDLERMKRGDRAFDVGRVAGELQHAFLLNTGRVADAEPFVGHFLREYCSHFPDRDPAFAAVTARTPYYMGLNMLRIAGNDWATPDYAAMLVGQARELLSAP
jgi:Ser/Thr protein kinase RdoA (MazF antagonist)